MNENNTILSRPKYVGKSVERFEDPKFLTGNAQYVSDINFDQMLHLVFVRSDQSHANIKSINFNAALKLEGIIDILTHENFKELDQIISPSRMSNYFATHQDVIAKIKVSLRFCLVDGNCGLRNCAVLHSPSVDAFTKVDAA